MPVIGLGPTLIQYDLILTNYIFFLLLSLSHAQLFATPWTAARQASLSFSISLNLLKLMSIELMMPSNHLILCRSLFLYICKITISSKITFCGSR